MPEYPNVPISECCDILDHRRIPVNEDERSQRIGIIPYYGANGLQGYIDNWIFDEPLILLAEDGGNFDDFINRAIAYRISGKTWVNNHAHVLRAKHGYVQDFVFYCLEHKDIRPSIKGGTRGKLNQADLKNIRIPRPEEPQQRRIAEILTTVDNQIEKTEALIAKYKSIKQGLMHDLFTRGVDALGRLRPIRDEAPQLYKESELGWIPNQWDIPSLGSIATKIQDGTHFSPKTDVGPCMYLTSKNIRFGYMDISDAGWISRREHDGIYARCDVRFGDVLLTKDGANTGNACLNVLRHEFSLLSSVAFIRFDEINHFGDFVLHYLLSQAGQQRLKDLMAGNAITRLTLRKIRAFRLPIAPPKEQRLLADALNAHTEKLNAEIRHAAKLRSIKLGLMQDLLTGKVPVKPEHSDLDNGVTSNGAAKSDVNSRAEGVHA